MTKAKKICLYGILTAVCLIFGYLETLLNLSFIAPGIKLGLSNAVCLLLIRTGDIKGAFAVNIARILLSALLFGSVFSLIFSLSAGLTSLIIMSLLSRKKVFSAVGFSMLGGVVHNIVQLICASVIISKSVVYYLPVLLASGLITGFIIGTLCELIYKKIIKKTINQ